jgi:SAM-dependent methyltransferase
MVIWRAWEYADYRSRVLAEPVLDVGCGDGRFFRCVWPSIANVTGVDINVGTANAARRSGVYRKVHAAPIHQAPLAPESFGSAFANCSLEHMDDLPAVLDAIAASLRPGGELLCSVVTDNLARWSSLPLLISAAGAADVARRIQADYDLYHHYVSVLTVDGWIEQIERAGFEVVEHVPILPLMTAHVFLLLDQAWHLPHRAGELGSVLQAFCKGTAGFPAGLVDALCGILKMEPDYGTGCGAIFLARRREGSRRDAPFRHGRDTAAARTAEPGKLLRRFGRIWERTLGRFK